MHDGGVCRQCIRAQFHHGLPDAAGHGASCGRPSSAPPVPAGRHPGRCLRGGGLSAGAWVSGGGAGKGGSWCAFVCGGVRRAGTPAAADGAAVRRLLRHGRLRTGTGAADRRRAGGKRHFLYRRRRPHPAAGRHGRLRRAGLDLSRGGPASGTAGAAGRQSLSGGCSRPANRAAGHRQRPERSGHRRGRVGDGTRCFGPGASSGGSKALDAGGADTAGRCVGAAVPGSTAAACFAAAVPVRWHAERAAAGGPLPLAGDRRCAVQRCFGGAGAVAAGRWISGPVGRAGERRPL